MDTKREDRIRIELTTEQQKAIKDATGENVQSLDFTAKELEERIAPIIFQKVKF